MGQRTFFGYELGAIWLLLVIVEVLLLSIQAQRLLWIGEKEDMIQHHFEIVAIALIMIDQAGLISSVLNILLSET